MGRELDPFRIGRVAVAPPRRRVAGGVGRIVDEGHRDPDIAFAAQLVVAQLRVVHGPVDAGGRIVIWGELDDHGIRSARLPVGGQIKRVIDVGPCILRYHHFHAEARCRGGVEHRGNRQRRAVDRKGERGRIRVVAGNGQRGRPAAHRCWIERHDKRRAAAGGDRGRRLLRHLEVAGLGAADRDQRRPAQLQRTTALVDDGIGLRRLLKDGHRAEGRPIGGRGRGLAWGDAGDGDGRLQNVRELIGRRGGRDTAAVATVTSTAPALVPEGLVATIWVAVSLTIVADTVPNFTAVALARFVPTIVTNVPPAVGPDAGLTPSPPAPQHR